MSNAFAASIKDYLAVTQTFVNTTGFGVGIVPAYKLDVSGDVRLSGGTIGIGSNPTTSTSVLGAGTAPLFASSRAVQFTQNISGAAGSSTYYTFSSTPLAAASAVVGTLTHYNASQGTFTGGAAVTNQYGFHAQSTLSGAGVNHGFRGDLTLGSGRYNLYMAGTADNYMAGALGVGTTTLTGFTLRSSKNLTGATYVRNIYAGGIVQPDVTSGGTSFETNLQLADGVTVSLSWQHFSANQSAFGTGTLTTQYGFYASASLTGATGNYGFFSDLAESGTARYNFFANGSAPNYMGGRLGIGQLAAAGRSLTVSRNITGSADGIGVLSNGTIQSDVTSTANLFQASANFAGTAFTVPTLRHFFANQNALGSTVVTEQIGYLVASTLTGATSNYGFKSDIASGAGRWNFYAAGTAQNFFGGDVLVSAAGNLLVTGSGTLGYGTGAGGAVTQATSRTTGVTLNKASGAITLFTAAGSTTATTFTVTNSTVAATDTIVINQKAGTNLYLAFVTAVAAGSFNVTFYTTGGTASDAPVFNFAVVKAVAA